MREREDAIEDGKNKGNDDVVVVPAACLWIRGIENRLLSPAERNRNEKDGGEERKTFPQSCSVQVATTDSVLVYIIFLFYIFLVFFSVEGIREREKRTSNSKV